jgi:hypothetical protein
MFRIRPKKLYYVALNKPKTWPDGGWSNFVSTPSLGRARYLAKRLKRAVRQIDVRVRGERRPYVLEGSWL